MSIEDRGLRVHDSDHTGVTVPSCAATVHLIADDVRIYRTSTLFKENKDLH